MSVLNTLSPGRGSRWILPDELATPDRPTSSGLQSPVGAPVQLGPSLLTREYSHPSLCCVPPAQWGDTHARERREEDCELFGDVLAGHESDNTDHPFEGEARQDELDQAAALRATDSMAEHLVGARCVNGNLIRPGPAEEEAPSTACRPNAVNAPGGVALDRGPPRFGTSRGNRLLRQMAPPPPPPPHTRPKALGGGGPPDGPGEAQGQDWETILIHAIIHAQEEDHWGPMGQEELAIQEAIQVVIQAPAVHLQTLCPHSSQEEQAIPVVLRQLHLQDFPIQEDTPIHGHL